MGFGDFAKGLVKNALKCGWICGHDFPVGSYLNMTSVEGEKAFLITFPNKTELKVTHDMVKCATVLAMGVIDIEQKGNVTTSIYGTKFLMVLKDGRQGVITTGLGDTCKTIESVLF